jgi:hypothetical protein
VARVFGGAKAACVATSFVALLLAGPAPLDAAQATIPVWSESLAKTLDPSDAPFTAIYRPGGKLLTFVAAEHVFTKDNRTIDAIRRAFADANPSVVIIEGIPTAYGRNPRITSE